MRMAEPYSKLDEEILSSGETVLIVSSLVTLMATLIAVVFGF